MLWMILCKYKVNGQCQNQHYIFVESPSKSGHLGIHNSQQKCAICWCTDAADCTLPLRITYTQVTAFAWWLHICNCVINFSNNWIFVFPIENCAYGKLIRQYFPPGTRTCAGKYYLCNDDFHCSSALCLLCIIDSYLSYDYYL